MQCRMRKFIRLCLIFLSEFRELESNIFNIKIQNEINVTPMRSYIEEWLERKLKQVAKERQQEVAIIPAVIKDILETAVISEINETIAARKHPKGSYVPSL
jgi:hypothetical protein